MEKAINIQKEEHEKIMNYYEKVGQSKGKQYQKGDSVLLARPAASKLDQSWYGPFVIIEIESEHRYLIMLYGKKQIAKNEVPKTVYAHPNQLKPFYAEQPEEYKEEMDFEHVYMDPTANADQSQSNQENLPKNVEVKEEKTNALQQLADNNYEVERIIDSKTHGHKVLFKVRWKGYSPDYDTWEPLPNLQNCKEAVADFIKAQVNKSDKRLLNLILTALAEDWLDNASSKKSIQIIEKKQFASRKFEKNDCKILNVIKSDQTESKMHHEEMYWDWEYPQIDSSDDSDGYW